MSGPARLGDVKVGGCIAALHAVDASGVHRLRSTELLAPYPARLTDRLEEHAARTPDKVLVAKRGADGPWQSVTYAQMLERVRRIGQALATRPLSADRPIAILIKQNPQILTSF